MDTDVDRADMDGSNLCLVKDTVRLYIVEMVYRRLWTLISTEHSWPGKQYS